MARGIGERGGCDRGVVHGMGKAVPTRVTGQSKLAITKQAHFGKSPRL